MEVKFNCTFCRGKIAADQSYAGLNVNCPSCDSPLEVPAPRFHTGATLGKFTILQCLGAGAAGEVYLAKEEDGFSEVALKVIAPNTLDPEDLDRFKKEVRLQASIHHPNIIPAYKAGEIDGYHYLSMAYIEGESLADRLQREGRIKEQEVLKIGLAVAKALEYAWEEVSLLHQDIKPANIMQDRNGQIMLADLGIAKSSAFDPGGTAQGFALGTPDYMSPEQAHVKPLDCRSDIYALGATMYHMLAGHPPHDAPTVAEVLARKFDAPAPDISEETPGIHKHTARLIHRMLSRTPDKRPADWTAQIAEIERVLAGDPPVPLEFPETQQAPQAKQPPAKKAVRHGLRPRRQRTKDHPRKQTSGRAGTLVAIAITLIGLILLIFLTSAPPPETAQQPTQPLGPEASEPTAATMAPPATTALTDPQRLEIQQLIDRGQFKHARQALTELAQMDYQVKELRQQIAQAEERAAQQKGQLESTLHQLARAIASGQPADAQRLARTLAKENHSLTPPSLQQALPALAHGFQPVIQQAYKAHLMQTISVATRKGPRAIKLLALDTKGLHCRMRTPLGFSVITIPYTALTVEEQATRLKQLQPNGLLLAGLLEALAQAPSAPATLAQVNTPFVKNILNLMQTAAAKKEPPPIASHPRSAPPEEPHSKKPDTTIPEMLTRLELSFEDGPQTWLKNLSARRQDETYMETVRSEALGLLSTHTTLLPAAQVTFFSFMAQLDQAFWPPAVSTPYTVFASHAPTARSHWMMNGNTVLTPSGAIIADDGSAELIGEHASSLAETCKETAALSLEVYLKPKAAGSLAPGCIASLASSTERNFSLVQAGSRLQLRLRTPQNGARGNHVVPDLFQLKNGVPVHILVTYANGVIRAYENGKLRKTIHSVQGDLSNWDDFPLKLASDGAGKHPWKGILYQFATYAKALTETEVRLHYLIAREVTNSSQ